MTSFCGLFFRIGIHYQRRRFLHGTGSLSQIVPIVIDGEGIGQRAYDIYSRLLLDRIICLMSPINDHIAGLIIAQMLFLEKESTQQPIHIYINTPGGSVTAGLGIYDTIQHTKAPVATWCIGQAASMGSLLLAAGTPGMRKSLPNARIMLHQPSGQMGGQATDMQIHAEEIIKMKRQLNGLYAKHTGQTIEVIERTLDRDRFLSSSEACTFGLVDEVISPT